jgi:hypothetical protein
MLSFATSFRKLKKLPCASEPFRQRLPRNCQRFPLSALRAAGGRFTGAFDRAPNTMSPRGERVPWFVGKRVVMSPHARSSASLGWTDGWTRNRAGTMRNHRAGAHAWRLANRGTNPPPLSSPLRRNAWNARVTPRLGF